MNKSVKFIMSTMLAGIMVTNMYGNVVLAEENDGDDTVIIIDGETDNNQNQDQIPEEFPEQNLDDGDEGETSDFC